MNTVIHIKANREVKENAQKLAQKLGLNLTDVINASLRNFIRTRTVVFTDIPTMTPEFEKKLDRIEKDIKEGKNLSPAFTSPEEMDKYLDSR
ncbi:MAG: hypothetical protein Q7S60_03970 [bacterium]|nr:hypothetical protein [bacterium]